MLVLLLGGWGFSSAVCISDSVKAVDTDQSQQGQIQAQDSCCILPILQLGCGQKLYRKPLVYRHYGHLFKQCSIWRRCLICTISTFLLLVMCFNQITIQQMSQYAVLRRLGMKALGMCLISHSAFLTFV